MLEFGSEIVGIAVVEKELSANDISNIIISAIEGGIGYWARLENIGEDWIDKPSDEPASLWATKLLLEGKSVEFSDSEDEDEIWELTLDKLIDGYAMNYKRRPHDSNIENGDATTADCIVQYALFNELVYG